METLLSSQLGGDPILGLQTEPGDQPPRPSTGSAKADAPVSVLETALGLTPGLSMWLLGSGKRFILLTRMEWKEMAQSWGSAWRAPVPLPPPGPAPPPLPPPLTPTPNAGAHSHPKRFIGAAGSASRFVGPFVRRSWCLGSGGYWGVPAPRNRGSPLLTLRLLEPPGEVFDAHVLELE